MKRSKLNNEELITLVAQSHCLWNPFVKNYRDKNDRAAAWQRISSILGVDLEAIQKRWRTLRDRYKRELNGSYPKKDNTPWDIAPLMSFLDKVYDGSARFENSWESQPIIPTLTTQPITCQPVIITVPLRKGPRPIAPKMTVEEIIPEAVKSTETSSEAHSNSLSGNESEEQTSKEPEIYLVTPTLFNDQEKTLFKNSLNPGKRKADVNDEECTDDDSTKVKITAIEEDAKIHRMESRRRLQWEERESILRMQFQEEEHDIKMQIERAKLKVEEENLKIQKQKLRVLIAKEKYYKGLLEEKLCKED